VQVLETLAPHLEDRGPEAVRKVNRALVPGDDGAELVFVDPQVHLHAVGVRRDPPELLERELEPFHDVGVASTGRPQEEEPLIGEHEVAGVELALGVRRDGSPKLEVMFSRMGKRDVDNPVRNGVHESPESLRRITPSGDEGRAPP
jgi:hypothetical protein